MKKRVFFLLVAALLMPWAMKAQVNLGHHVDITMSECDSYTWPITGATFSNDTVVTHIVGDTLYILDLTINHSVTNVVTEPINGGCTYQWGDTLIVDNGTYTKTFTTTEGCDSTVTITLSLSENAPVSRDLVVCDEYAFYGQTYTESGTYTITDTTSNPNCDSIITLGLTVKPIEQKNYDTIVVACESTEWIWSPQVAPIKVTENGRVITSESYSQSSAATRRLFHPRTAERCYDSLITVTFNIKKDQYATLPVAACDIYYFSYSVANSDTSSIDTSLVYTFTKRDTIHFTKLASNGCDSVIVADITINKNPIITISGDLRVAPGSNVTLRASSNQPNTYFTWHDGSHDSVFTRNNVTENFDAYVTGKNNNTNCSQTSHVTVLANLSINMAEDNAINVYPNPTSAVINISSDEAIKSVTVFSLNGQQMISAKGVNSVDLNALANGTYVVRVDLESGKVATRTIVVSK